MSCGKWRLRNAPRNLASPAGLEPACLCVRSAVLIRLSYGEMVGDWLPSQESNLPQVRLTAGRVHLARLMGINFWWRNRESNPGRRSCKDQLQPAAFPVPGRGFEPRSPRLRRGAFTRLAYQA